MYYSATYYINIFMLANVGYTGCIDLSRLVKLIEKYNSESLTLEELEELAELLDEEFKKASNIHDMIAITALKKHIKMNIRAEKTFQFLVEHYKRTSKVVKKLAESEV